MKFRNRANTEELAQFMSNALNVAGEVSVGQRWIDQLGKEATVVQLRSNPGGVVVQYKLSGDSGSFSLEEFRACFKHVCVRNHHGR